MEVLPRVCGVQFHECGVLLGVLARDEEVAVGGDELFVHSVRIFPVLSNCSPSVVHYSVRNDNIMRELLLFAENLLDCVVYGLLTPKQCALVRPRNR